MIERRGFGWLKRDATPGRQAVSFGDWALAQRTRPNEVLEKIRALVDLSQAERRLERPTASWPTGPPGGVLLRVMLLQHLTLERSAGRRTTRDRLSFQKFVGYARRSGAR